MLQKLLNEQVLDPKNPYKIYDLAREYDRLGQGAMAVSLYIKAADLADEDDKLLQYKSILGVGKCYNRQGNRRWTVESAYLDAAALMPERPEAHYFLSTFYEGLQVWKSSLYHAAAGLNTDPDLEDIDIGYPGRKALAFQWAVAKWYIAGTQVGKHALFDMKFKVVHEPHIKARVDRMLNNIYYPDTIPFQKEDAHRFKFGFDGIENIRKNYSKHFQDMFVLSVFKGKRKGTYLEIGSGDPFVHNNTALLETQFDWRGISIDNSPSLCYNFRENRQNTIICADATEIGYEDLFDKHCVDINIDYLQVDCDEASVEILKKLPLKTHKFGVITFEHDSYRLGTEIRDEVRSLLKKHGYVLLVNDVAFSELCAYEDWYVHPDLVEIDTRMKSKKEINFVWDYFMEELNEENERKV